MRKTQLHGSEFTLSPSTDGVCNAVWDGNLGMCFGILECPSGHMVGVKVHTALNPALHLKDKVSLLE